MKYKLFTLGAIACALMSFTSPAMAMSFASVEDRADVVRNTTGDTNNYHAFLAKELASIAESEISDHDLRAARTFIIMAEEEAIKAGGK